MNLKNLAGAAAVAVLSVSAGCTQTGRTDAAGGEAASGQTAELAARVQRLEDNAAIQKVQAKYAHYLFTQDYDKIFSETFAQERDDVSVEFSDSGVYRGPESIRALYAGFNVTREIPGFFIMHMLVNPYIEIAADGQSARSHWLSPGATGSNSSAGWVFGPYYIDYVKEDGEWRILHSNLAPIFRNAYDVSWAAATDNGTVRGVLPVDADEPSTLYRPYHEVKRETDIFRNHPNLPEPY
jgi:hypothetical protein